MLIHETIESLRASLADKGQKHSKFNRWRRDVLSGLEQALVVKADNVAQLVRDTGGQGLEWPQAKPFSPYTWVEYAGGSDDDDAAQAVGVLVVCTDVPEEERETAGRWLIEASSFFKPKKGVSKVPLVAAPYSVITTLNADGAWDGPVEFYDPGTYELLETSRENELDYGDKKAAAVPLAIALLAFCFAHCRNVIKIDHAEPWYKKSKRTLLNVYGGEVKYQTIKIDPVKKKTTAEAGAEKDSVGSNRAMHICRGHFKTFEPGHGLFGKYVGQYWWGQQLRGNKAAGMVISDYSTERLVQ